MNVFDVKEQAIDALNKLEQENIMGVDDTGPFTDTGFPIGELSRAMNATGTMNLTNQQDTHTLN